MSLLNNIFAQPLDPGYEAAARRAEQERQAAAAGAAGGDDDGDTAGAAAPATSAGAPRRGGIGRLSPALLLGGLALGVLFTAAVLQVRDSATVVTAERESLIERIRAEEMHAENLQQQAADLEDEIATLEDRQLQNSAAGQALRDDVQGLQAIAGTVAVEGPGIRVVLDNAPEGEDVDDPDLARVLDIDVQQVVNGLWLSGAEAISVNGQRLTPLTAIRSVDFVVQVNYRPLTPPYEIVAVGDSRTLASRFSEGVGGQWLRAASDAGIEYSINNEDHVELPAGSAALDFVQPQEDT